MISLFQVENINTCLTFLANLGVNIEGLTAKGEYHDLDIGCDLVISDIGCEHVYI